MKTINLTQNKVAIVDDNMFEELNRFNWCYSKGYAVRVVGGRKNPKTVYMHRLVLKTPTKKITDHINRNTLDNRISNLRISDKSHNMFNTGLSVRNKSGIKGVSWNSKKKRWKVQFSNKFYGYYKNIKDASIMRYQLEADYWLRPRKV